MHISLTRIWVGILCSVVAVLATSCSYASPSTGTHAPAASAPSCSNLSTQGITAALGGPITSSNASSGSWSSTKTHVTLQCAVHNSPWPASITGDFTTPIAATNPCPSGIYASGAASPFVGAFCSKGGNWVGMILDSDTIANGNTSFWPISAAQASAVSALMTQALG